MLQSTDKNTRDVQQTNSLHVLAVIRAVLTRWTAHYDLAYRRLLEIRLSFQILVENDNKLELRTISCFLGMHLHGNDHGRILRLYRTVRSGTRFQGISFSSIIPPFVPLAFLRQFVHSEQFINYSSSHARCKSCNIPATRLYSCSCIYRMRYDLIRVSDKIEERCRLGNVTSRTIVEKC